jgi:hypothetical protein
MIEFVLIICYLFLFYEAKRLEQSNKALLIRNTVLENSNQRLRSRLAFERFRRIPLSPPLSPRF